MEFADWFKFSGFNRSRNASRNDFKKAWDVAKWNEQKTFYNRLVRRGPEHILDAPCIFCGYNGERFHRDKSHYIECPRRQ